MGIRRQSCQTSDTLSAVRNTFEPTEPKKRPRSQTIAIVDAKHVKLVLDGFGAVPYNSRL